MFESVPGDRARLRVVESELLTLAGNLAAATCRYLQLLAEFDTAGGWSGPGLRSCAHWLNWKAGENLRTAREHLRVAHALTTLPLITAAFAAGQVSYAKVRAMTRIATPDTEDGLLGIALHGTASQVETVVADARAQQDPRPVAAKRGMTWSGTADGSLRVTLRLPADQGHLLITAVDAALADDDSADDNTDTTIERGSAEPPGTRKGEPRAARRLDALLSLITGQRSTPDTTLVVHLRADLLDHPANLISTSTDASADGPAEPSPPAPTLRPVTADSSAERADDPAGAPAPPSSATPDGSAEPRHPSLRLDQRTAWIEGGPTLNPAVAERLTCAAAVQALITDRDDHPLYLGRRRRTATPAQLCALRVRDHDHCTFPGCTTTRHLAAHHVWWWRHGGLTDLDNLVLLCSAHHHLVHDGGYQLRPDGHGGFTAATPDSTPIPTAGAPTRGRQEALRLPGIDAATTTPAWGGEPLDRDLVLAWLLPALRSTPAAAA